VRLAPNTLVVFEGPDATGKTTQIDRMARLFPDDVTVHSPSGGGPLGEAIYVMTEATRDGLQPLTRQFLHLAAHTEVYAHTVFPTLADGRGVFMDRNWWSTVAYSRGLVTDEVARWPTNGREPDLTFLFRYEYQADEHNTLDVRNTYRRFAEEYAPTTVEVPRESLIAVTEFIVTVLTGRHLVDPEGYA